MWLSRILIMLHQNIMGNPFIPLPPWGMKVIWTVFLCEVINFFIFLFFRLVQSIQIIIMTVTSLLAPLSMYGDASSVSVAVMSSQRSTTSQNMESVSFTLNNLLLVVGWWRSRLATYQGGAFSWFPWHEATRSINNLPLDGMQVHHRVIPSI